MVARMPRLRMVSRVSAVTRRAAAASLTHPPATSSSRASHAPLAVAVAEAGVTARAIVPPSRRLIDHDRKRAQGIAGLYATARTAQGTWVSCLQPRVARNITPRRSVLPDKTGVALTAGRPYVIGAVLSLLVAAGSAPDLAGAAARDKPGSVGQLAPLVFQGLRSPIPFKGSDGRTHLAYVVTIQNSGPVPVKINKVAVLDAHRDKVISSVSGKTLVGRLGLLATPVAPLKHATLGSSQAGAYWVDVVLKPGASVPKRLQHRITATPVGPSFYEGRDTVTAAPLTVSKKKAVRLVPPLAGERWVDLTGCCTGVPNHRHALFASAGRLYDAQEFAIDFMRFDDQDRLWVGDKSDPKDYIVYGAPVLAVADATVVAMTNNLPDQRPLSPSAVPPTEADGNFIMLDLGDGRYANYAHLAPGSVTVKVGERVKAGQQMALIGNSGQTGAPHLHFHVMDRPLLAEANGLPYEFDAFTVTGVARLNSIDRALTTGSTTKVSPVGRGAHANELPLELTVLDFPAPRP
jgi:hypothetical protein